jgi:radical SAM-linked protein
MPPGPRPAPAAARLIVRYAKRGRLRFASHRDVARAIERGVRKAGLPIALSAGFTPHPKISYAGAAPTGTASEAEYLELSLTEHCDPSEVRDRLDAALPDGIDVIDVMDGPVPLADLRLEVSEWQVVLPGIGPGEAARAVGAFLALSSAEVERLTSKGMRRVDARAAVAGMTAGGTAAGGTAAGRRAAEEASDGNAILRMVVRHVVPAVRPDDILTALRRETGLAPASPPLVTRLAQGPDDGAAVSSPAGADRPAGRDGPGGLERGQGAPEQEEATRIRAADPPGTAAARVSAYDQFPRGAGSPGGGPAPGSLTGDCPDARKRAEQRVQQ